MRATRNRVYGNPVSRVQIPLSPPELTRRVAGVLLNFEIIVFYRTHNRVNNSILVGTRF